MESFNAAKTKEELEKVEELDFDKYFMNLENPRIFKEMLIGRRRKKLWKKTYGFDYVFFKKNKFSSSTYGCYEHCLKAEFHDFAKKCKQKRGFFKCCMFR